MSVWVVVALATATVGFGFFGGALARSRIGRVTPWLWALLAITGTHFVTLREPAGMRMLLLVTVTFIAMKLVVLVADSARSGSSVGPLRWVAFAVAWPGMRPVTLNKQAGTIRDAGQHAAWGLGNVVFGMALVEGALLLNESGASRWATTPQLLAGCSFVLHFGVFRLVVALWRALGFDRRPLFRAPILARSLREFWGSRWNLAFSEMLQETVYRPLQGRWGRSQARFASFGVSGLLHEVAISVPVGGGYGLPTVYFLLQGWLVHLEAAAKTPRGRVLVLAQILIPILLVAHLPFLRGIVWPWLPAS
ncbi:MAG: membrane bound O-acyl transferase family-domain-containing protein [Planctomycetota bacterium]